MKKDMTSSIASALFLAQVTVVAADDLKSPDANPKCEDVESIGVAWMAEDGKIGMQIRSPGPGPIVEGELFYKPGDPDYDSIVKHLGGLAPGQTKPVKPWC